MSMQETSTPEDRARRLKWFAEARFGMFIHWGLYAQLGRHEWVMNRERIPVAEYEKLADTWKPRPYPARQWAKLARQAGMKYMVMTTKHHEGFLLWDSKLSDYNAAKRGPGRDLVAEYVEAARAEGLRVGFYYSLMDWHHPDGANCARDEAARKRFVEYTHGLVRELMTNYGKIDILWYDVAWPLEAEGWQSFEMNTMVRRLQPDILINNRSKLPEDFGTPEQHIRPEPEGRAWEACMTMNDSWGYTPIDRHYKDGWETVGMLIQCAAGGGNLLLNIGPAPDGSIPSESVRVLREVGHWMAINGEAIYGSERIEAEWMPIGQFTARGSTMYLHVRNWPGPTVVVGGLVNKVKSARLLATGESVRFEQSENRLLLHDLPIEPPDPFASVIALEVEGKPLQRLGAGCVIL